MEKKSGGLRNSGSVDGESVRNVEMTWANLGQFVDNIPLWSLVGHGSIFADQIQSNPIHQYLGLNRTRKLYATNYTNGDF